MNSKDKSSVEPKGDSQVEAIDKPLKGITIVITRAEEKGIVLKKDLKDRGAQVINVPCIRFGPPEDDAPLKEILNQIDQYSWILFTSSVAVETFFDKAREFEVPDSIWSRFKFGVVGPSTASQLASMGIKVERMVVAGTAQALKELLLPEGSSPLISSSDRCLFPQGDLARQELPQGLKQARISFDPIVVYCTLPEERQKAQPFLHRITARQPIHAIAFASPSAFHNFLSMTEPDGERAIREQNIAIFSIGPTTSQAIRERGLQVTGEALPHTSKGLKLAIQHHFAPQSILAEEEQSSVPHDLTVFNKPSTSKSES